MGAYLARRLLVNLIVFIVITIAIFTLVHLAPGDPISMMIPPSQMTTGSAAFIANKRHELGLDQPIIVQYFHWCWNAMHGDLGYSLFSGRPVSAVIGERLGPTLELMGVGMAIAILIAFVLGIVAAVRRNTSIDYAATAFSLSVVAFPVFFLALIAIFLFSLTWRWLPSAGITDYTNPTLINTLKHLVMPATILGIGLSGPLMRYVRGSLIGELHTDYVQTALAKGASPARAVLRHALRNALIPVITIIATELPALVAGAVVIEQVFAWPGMGQLAITSVTHSDYPVVVGFALMIALVVLISNTLADVLYPIIDPRVRLS